MKKTVLYVHGKGGTAEEAEHYRPLFPDAEVIGFAYRAQTPWEAREEFPRWFDAVCANAGTTLLIANSIGAYFAMSALADKKIENAYFISPIVDMEKLIGDMMGWAKVTEEELRRKKEIETAFGETLSWKYLCDVREHPLEWNIPTRILYGKNDHLTAEKTIRDFAAKKGMPLTIMANGEHWFHTDEQMAFLDRWLGGGAENAN